MNQILIIRFRQIGDAVLSTALCNTLKQTFPQAQIHFVLNKGIAPLFENHPSIDKIITFDKDENSNFFKYIKKVKQTMRSNKYDVIIDMRSTIRTLLFSMFSLQSPFRVGRKKWYTRFILNYRIDNLNPALKTDRVMRNLMLAQPLEKITKVKYTNVFNVFISDIERENFRKYMQQQGIDFSKPVILAGVTSKLAEKTWKKEFMEDIIKRIIDNYDVQIIFNFAPGREEENAKQMYAALGQNAKIFVNVEACTLRQLAALCANVTFYFGNEGGARHVAHSFGVPSFVIVSPKADEKTMWLPKNNTFAQGVCADDILPKSEQKERKMTTSQLYDLITPDVVWQQLQPIFDKFKIGSR